MRVVARRQSPCVAWSATACARRKLTSGGSASAAAAPIASSSSAITCGNASRKNPEIRSVTSILDRPSSAAGTISNPVTRRDASSHTGRQPISARTSAMSSPWVRMAEVPHTARPTQRGYSPSSARCLASSESASARPVRYELRDGMAFGSTE